MVEKVMCVTKGCDWENQEKTTTWLFLNKIAALDGPYICPECKEPMTVTLRTLASHKPGAGAKPAPKSRVKAPVGKKPAKKTKKFTIKGKVAGYTPKPIKKTSAKKPGLRKRGPSKS